MVFIGYILMCTYVVLLSTVLMLCMYAPVAIRHPNVSV